MNREIKFRAWNKNNKKMYYDAQNTYDYGCTSDNEIEESRFADLLQSGIWVIMQYTGLKDKNGKEVYIGDILKYTFTDYKGKELWTENYIVKENISGWEMRNITKPRGQRSLSLVKNYKVIGNIYDNPELLEV